MSTGIQSAVAFGSANAVWENPLQPPTMRPTGPLKLSIHPGNGSVQVGITA